MSDDFEIDLITVSSPDVDSNQGKKKPANRWLTLIPLFASIDPVALGVYALARHSWSVFGYGLAVSACAALVGGLVGILFGIPRSVEGSGSTKSVTPYRGNTNLEQISDWLTKILVGVGLVQIGRAPAALARLGHAMSSGFGGRATSVSFGLAIAIFMAIAGFMYLYLWSRIFLFEDLSSAEVKGD